MRLVFVSDTHGKHDLLRMPDGDLLIHCGDATMRGGHDEWISFGNWTAQMLARYPEGVIFVPGNHDITAELQPNLVYFYLPGVAVLTHDGITVKNKKIWCSSWTPKFGHNWAFQIQNEAHAQSLWSSIPSDVDVLVTHGPPMGKLDRVARNGLSVGCSVLAKVVNQIQPKIHAFGHIHEGAGVVDTGTTMYVNASVLNERYELVHSPIVIDLK